MSYTEKEEPAQPGVGKGPWVRYTAHYSAGQKIAIVRGHVQMHVRIERSTLLLPSVKTVQSGCHLKSLATASCCMRSSQLAYKRLVFSSCLVCFYLSPFALKTHGPVPGKRTLLHCLSSTAAAHSGKEDAARAGLTFVVSVVRGRCGSWPQSGQMDPQVAERQVDLHTVWCVLLLTQSCPVFLCHIYSFLLAHTSCLSGSCFNESSKGLSNRKFPQ